MNRKLVTGRAVLALAAGIVCSAAPAGAQDALRVIVARENVRAAPSGTKIAEVLEGAPLTGGETQGRWREITLDAWVREDGVMPTTRDGRDLAIRRTGTTLHASRGGDVIARGQEGFLVDEVAREAGWVRVRRTAWIWSASVGARSGSAPVTRSAPAVETSEQPRTSTAAASRPAQEPASGGGRAERPASAVRAASTSGARTVHAAPDGARLGTLAPGAQYDVLEQRDGWARVRVDGWIRTDAAPGSDPASPIRGLSLRAMREDPEEYDGRTIAWRVQYVSLQQADSLRTDLEAGEHYILARDPGGEPGYVYIVVDQEQLPAVRRLIPLQQVEVVGRVRTGRSELMGHPVLDLIELSPTRS